MTTVLHRPVKRSYLLQDFIIKNKATKGIDDTTPEAKAKTIEITRNIIKIIYNNHPVNMGQGRLGCLAQGRTIDNIIEGVTNIGGLSASTFDNKQSVVNALTEIKENDYGQSITVAGPLDEIFNICKEIGTEPHTAIVPLGIWGNTKLLPEQHIKDLTLMCGHGLISQNLARHVITRVNAGIITSKEGAQELAKVCICGAFNLTVALEIIEEAIKGKEGKENG